MTSEAFDVSPDGYAMSRSTRDILDRRIPMNELKPKRPVSIPISGGTEVFFENRACIFPATERVAFTESAKTMAFFERIVEKYERRDHYAQQALCSTHCGGLTPSDALAKMSKEIRSGYSSEYADIITVRFIPYLDFCTIEQAFPDIGNDMPVEIVSCRLYDEHFHRHEAVTIQKDVKVYPNGISHVCYHQEKYLITVLENGKLPSKCIVPFIIDYAPG